MRRLISQSIKTQNVRFIRGAFPGERGQLALPFFSGDYDIPDRA